VATIVDTGRAVRDALLPVIVQGVIRTKFQPPERTQAYVSVMSETLPITEARARFGSLVRRASTTRERITITDHGVAAAVLINAQELADLEDDLALAQYRARQAEGTVETVLHREVRRRLGLDQA
jgi:prevent-host-death family protein